MLKFWLIVDGPSVKKEFFVSQKARVPDALKVGLTFGQEGVVVQVVPDSAIPREDFLLPGDLIEGDEVAVELHINQNRDEDFEGEVQFHLDEHAHRAVFSPGAESHALLK
jgi:hypothetical protein